jgi:hypothetical protein
MSSSGAARALDRLYEAPLERFVALRRELSATLRASGDTTGSSEVAAAKKPSRTAWAINQLARRHPERVTAAFEAYTAAERAQAEGEATAMRQTARAFRDSVAEVVRAAAAMLVDTGARTGATQQRQLAETVRAAAAGGPAARARLMSGQLSEDLVVDDAFAGTAERGPGRSARPAPATKEEPRKTAAAVQRELRERQARERALEEQRRRVEALEREAREARAAARQAEVALLRAQGEADRARRAVGEIEERLLAARHQGGQKS